MSKIILNSIKHPNSLSDNIVVNADGSITAVNTIQKGIANIYQHIDRADRSISGATWTNMGLDITVSPESVDSNFHLTGSYYISTTGGNTISVTWWRVVDGVETNLSQDILGDNGAVFAFAHAHTQSNFMLPMNIEYIDKPNTTSDVTYSLRAIMNQGSGRMNFWHGGGFQGVSRSMVVEYLNIGGNINV